MNDAVWLTLAKRINELFQPWRCGRYRDYPRD